MNTLDKMNETVAEIVINAMQRQILESSLRRYEEMQKELNDIAAQLKELREHGFSG